MENWSNKKKKKTEKSTKKDKLVSSYDSQVRLKEAMRKVMLFGGKKGEKIKSR